MPEKSYLFREIHQQPEVLRSILKEEAGIVRRLAAEIVQRNVSYVVIAARGTSDNAGRYAKYLLGAVNRLPVALATPSLFSIYERPPRFGNALVLGISQSGVSPDIVTVLAEARRQGALTATITNFPDSNLAREASCVINLNAGIEHAIAATKTYTAELAAIALLSAILADDKGMQTELTAIPDAVADALATGADVARAAQRYRYMRDCVIIGRGYNYATAFELALKLKELDYIFAEPYSSADFLHGPLALLEPGFPAIVIAPSGRMLPEMQDFMATLRQREAEIIAISDDPAVLTGADIPLTLPRPVPEWLSPITAIVPGQLLAMHLTHIRGYDPDHPRGLRKVTETR